MKETESQKFRRTQKKEIFLMPICSYKKEMQNLGKE